MKILVIAARWLLVLPVSVIAGELAWLLFYFSTVWVVGRPDWFLDYAWYGLWMGALNVYVTVSTAAYVAPTRKTATAMVLAVVLFTVCLLYAAVHVPVLLSNFNQWSFHWYTSDVSADDPMPLDLLNEDLAPFRGISGVAMAIFLIIQMWRGEQPLPAEVSETAWPPTMRTGTKRKEQESCAVPAGAVPRADWRKGRWLVLASVAVGLGLVLVTWWSSDPKGTPVQREAGEDWINSLDMEFVWVPAGNFVMGSPIDEDGRFLDESQHEVQISKGYWMKKHEVTQGEWVAVMETNPSHFSDCGPQCPVEEVSWDATQEFMRRLNEWESAHAYRYRLPTEAEWEYAARAGATGTRYGELDAIAWHAVNSGRRTHPVGQKRANAWGLHDMLGNVWEWTGDWHGDFVSGSMTDPEGPWYGWHRVARGGGWGTLAGGIRFAHRGGDMPVERYADIGFRLVRTE